MRSMTCGRCGSRTMDDNGRGLDGVETFSRCGEYGVKTFMLCAGCVSAFKRWLYIGATDALAEALDEKARTV
jgi:hypothetical protein